MRLIPKSLRIENSAEWCSEEDEASGRQDSMLEGVAQFPPGDELDVLFLKQLAELEASEEIEIALAPGGAPSITLARGGFHLFVGKGDVNDELGDARLKCF